MSISPDLEYSILVEVDRTGTPPAALKQAVARRCRSLPAWVSVEISANDLRGGNESIAGEMGSAEGIPDLVISLRGPAGDKEGRAGDRERSELQELAAELFAGLFAPLAATVTASTVMVANRYRLLDGEGPVRIFYGIRRLSHLTPAQFQDYWLHTHGDIGRQLLKPFSYYQAHVLRKETEAFARRCGLPASDLDGVVNIHFPDMDAFNYQTSRKDVGDIAIADERNFLDHSRLQFGVMSVLTVN